MKTSNFPYVAEVRRENFAKGLERGLEQGLERVAEAEAKTRAEMLAERLERDAKRVERVLDQRGIAMTDADRKQIVSCRDEGTLNDWLDHMVTVATVAELFVGETEEEE
jgi:hypothetical protein